MKKTIALILTALLTLGLVACGSETKTDDADKTEDKTSTELTGTVSTDGSTSMEKVIGALGESFMAANKDVKFTYNPTGSGSGIQAVSEDRCDIGLSSRALKDEEKAKGLEGTVLAYDGIAIVVSPENPVSDLDVDTIAKIYTGEITNWKEVGGADAAITVINRASGSGTRATFEAAVLGDTKVQDNTSVVSITQCEPNHLKYTVKSATGGIIVFSEVYYPGWTATIDGKPAELGRVNYVLRALNVGAGDHEVELDFHPQSISVTETVAYIACALLLAVIIFMILLNGRNKQKKQ